VATKHPAVIEIVTLTSMLDALTFVKVLELATVPVPPHPGHAVVVHPANGQVAAAVPQLNVQSVANAGTAQTSANSANASARARFRTRQRAARRARRAGISDFTMTIRIARRFAVESRVLSSPT